MRRAAIAACLVLPVLVQGQSLGDAAKKERERRAKVKETAAAKTVTDEELAANKGSLANDPKPATPAKTAATPSAGSPAVALESEASEARAPSGANGEAYWRAAAGQARLRIEEARRRYDAIQRMLHFGSGHKDANGEVVIYSNQQLKAMGDKAEADVKAAEAALERLVDDGRRAGALPGWLR
jgi:hypothetical protein